MQRPPVIFPDCNTEDTRSFRALALTPSLSGEDVLSLQQSSPCTAWPEWESEDTSANVTEERLETARRQLAKLQRERDALHAANAALQALADTSAYLLSLLSDHNLHISAGPSARLSGCPSTRAVAEIFRVGLKGLQPPETAYAAFGHVPLDRYMDLEIDFRAGMGRMLQLDWAAAEEINDRRRIEHALANAVNVREKARLHIFKLAPKAALHYWRTTTATAEDIAARQSRQSMAIGTMKMTPKQIEGVRKAWKAFCLGMQDVEAAKKSAEKALIRQGVHEAPALHNTADGKLVVAAGTAVLEDLAQRQLMLYHELMRGVVAALTWAQATMIAVIMSPYSADFVELCNEILFMGPKVRR